MSDNDMRAIVNVDESTTIAILWLMIRYQKTGCKEIAYLIEQYLDLLVQSCDDMAIAAVYKKVYREWRGVSNPGCRQYSSTIRH